MGRMSQGEREKVPAKSGNSISHWQQSTALAANTLMWNDFVDFSSSECDYS
jgi:hypothetical protein